jgi:hypothetical protein
MVSGDEDVGGLSPGVDRSLASDQAKSPGYLGGEHVYLPQIVVWRGFGQGPRPDGVSVQQLGQRSGLLLLATPTTECRSHHVGSTERAGRRVQTELIRHQGEILHPLITDAPTAGLFGHHERCPSEFGPFFPETRLVSRWATRQFAYLRGRAFGLEEPFGRLLEEQLILRAWEHSAMLQTKSDDHAPTFCAPGV